MTGNLVRLKSLAFAQIQKILIMSDKNQSYVQKISRLLSEQRVVLAVVAILVGIIAVVTLSESFAQKNSLGRYPQGTNLESEKKEREVDKLVAEIRQIRSQTGGSLFWLNLFGVFVTVGGAVGGYVIAQRQNRQEQRSSEEKTERERLEFEHRKDIDSQFQELVQELTLLDRPLLRAAAAMKLGALLKKFPSEWNVSETRRIELLGLTKQILATALALEESTKVQKAIMIAVAMHPDLQNLNFSGVQATNAYWAKRDFTYADFYQANLSYASFRKATLNKAQFWGANLQEAVLAGADCTESNFKLADLQRANFQEANIKGANFIDAKNLTIEQIKSAKNWEQAHFDEDLCRDLNLTTSPDKY